MGVSAVGLEEGCSTEIGSVDEYRVVAVLGDPVVVCNPLVLGGGVLGDSGGIASESEGPGGRHRRC